MTIAPCLIRFAPAPNKESSKNLDKLIDSLTKKINELKSTKKEDEQGELAVYTDFKKYLVQCQRLRNKQEIPDKLLNFLVERFTSSRAISRKYNHAARQSKGNADLQKFYRTIHNKAYGEMWGCSEMLRSIAEVYPDLKKKLPEGLIIREEITL